MCVAEKNKSVLGNIGRDRHYGRKGRKEGRRQKFVGARLPLKNKNGTFNFFRFRIRIILTAMETIVKIIPFALLLVIFAGMLYAQLAGYRLRPIGPLIQYEPGIRVLG
jgi:hypothetical protein